jgi:hypothetical protein
LGRGPNFAGLRPFALLFAEWGSVGLAFPLPPPCGYQSTDSPRRNRPFGVERNHSFWVCAPRRLGTTICSIVKPATPHPPPRNSGPAFLIALGCSYAVKSLMYATSPLTVYIRDFTPIRMRAHNTRRYERPIVGGLGPIGAGLCRLSRRRELRLYGVLRSSQLALCIAPVQHL